MPDSSQVKRDSEGRRRATAVIKFIEKLTVPSGHGMGRPFKLEPFQKLFIRAIYEPHLGLRRAVRRVILSIARKNGKTALIESEYFRIDSFCLEAGQEAVALAEHLAARSGGPAILFVATGGCSLQVEGGQFLLHQGQVAVVPQRSGNWKLQAEEAGQVICMTPGRP